MAFNIEAEIARRLNVSPDAVGPVLDAVIERIRQQVSHYGYARLAGLGTFRGQDSEIAFEPDTSLSDEVNVRYAGFEEVVMEAVGEVEEEEEREEERRGDEVVYGDSPGDDYERESPVRSDDVDEGDELDVQDEPKELDVRDELDALDDLDEEDAWDESIDAGAAEPQGAVAPDVSWGGEDADAVEDVSRDEWDEKPEDVYADEFENADTWLAEPDETDALEPAAERPIEETDHSVVDEPGSGGWEEFDDEMVPAGGDLEDEGAGELQAPEGADEDEFEVVEADDDDADPYDPADTDEIRDGGPSVEWSPLDEPLDEDQVEDEKAAIAASAGGAAFAAGGEQDYDEAQPAHEKAPDRVALPHERIRQHPSRRHAAAAGEGAAGGNRNSVWIGVGIIVLVAAAGIAYFVMTPTPTTTTDEPTLAEQSETQLPADTVAASAAAGDTSAADFAAATPSQTADPSTADPPSPSSPPAGEASESTPLRSSDGIDPANDGYTIIVYSETSRSGAEGVAARYREEGFRTGVLVFQEDGPTRYRVGVGQFETLDEASETRDGLAGDELPEDAWVRRVQ